MRQSSTSGISLRKNITTIMFKNKNGQINLDNEYNKIM